MLGSRALFTYFLHIIHLFDSKEGANYASPTYEKSLLDISSHFVTGILKTDKRYINISHKCILADLIRIKFIPHVLHLRNPYIFITIYFAEQAVKLFFRSRDPNLRHLAPPIFQTMELANKLQHHMLHRSNKLAI